MGELVTFFNPTGPGAGAPRFRQVNVRRRVTAVAVALSVFVGIGWVAYAYGVNSGDGFATPCVPDAGPPVVEPDDVPVNVYNSTSERGLADTVATGLEERGFTVGEVGNDPLRRRIRGTGEIRTGPDADRQVTAVRAYVPGAQIVEDPDRDGLVIDLVLGSNFDRLTDEPTSVQPANPNACEPSSSAAAGPAGRASARIGD